MADIIIGGKNYDGVSVLRVTAQDDSVVNYIEQSFIGGQVASGTVATLAEGAAYVEGVPFRPTLVLFKFKSHPNIQRCNNFAAALDPYKADPDAVRADYVSAAGAASLLDVNVYPDQCGFGVTVWDEGNNWAQVGGLELEYIAARMDPAQSQEA